MREAPAEGYNYIFGLRSSNTSTADAADFAIKKTSAREVVFMVPVSRLTSLCFVAASSQGRRYPRLACSSWSNYRFGSSSCYINTIKKTSAREVVFMVPVSRLELPTHALRMQPRVQNIFYNIQRWPPSAKNRRLLPRRLLVFRMPLSLPETNFRPR